MTSQARCIVREADCGVMLGKTEEGVAEVIDIEDGHVVLDHVGDVHENLIKPQTLHLTIPRVRFNELVKLFARISETADILSQFDNDIWTYSLRVANEL